MNYSSLHPECLISVDVEAAGPIPCRYALLSIGACLVDDVENRFYAELRPDPPMPFVEDAVRVGWPDAPAGETIARLLREGLAPRDAIRNLDRWVSAVSEGRLPVYVGFAAAFDWMFTHQLFISELGADPFGHTCLDIKSFWAGASGCSWVETSKDRLPSWLTDGLGEHSHRADEDAVRQARIFDRMRAAVRKAG